MKKKVLAFLFAAVACLPLLPSTARADASKPWDLRNLYRIPIERGVLIYAEDNAEWRVLMDSGEVLADRIGFAITLEDGTEIRNVELEDGVSDRERFTGDLGEGTVYSVTFPEKNGLRIVHTLKTFSTRPFVFVEITVENAGTSDVQIASIRPVVAERSVMQALGPEATVRHRRVQDIGGQPVAAPGKDATMAVLYDPAKPISFGVGLIPTGLSRPVVQFKENEKVWQGDISCHYEPYKTVKPGGTLVSDPLWISHGVPEPDRVDLNYSWVYSTMVKVPKREFKARGWYTLPEDQGLDAYVSAGDDWKGVGIDHVLLGRGWEGRPGSMDGAGSRFPKSMKQAVGSLVQAGLQTGIMIDPLSAPEGGTPWTATSSDGLAWLNPSLPEGKQAVVKKAGTLKEWGASFVVVDYSLVPDEILSGFGLTRMEAQNLAYTAIREAADPLPVFPSSVSSVNGDVNQWLDAGSSVARMAVYGMEPGPLQCALAGAATASPDFITAVQFWPGPIEFSGALNRKIREGIVEMVSKEHIAGQPVDAQHDAPRTWNVQKHDTDGKLLEEQTISLSGAAPVSQASRTDEEGKDGSAS